MNGDIESRLRTKYKGQLSICIEAANEIERLRKELIERKYRMIKLMFVIGTLVIATLLFT